MPNLPGAIHLVPQTPIFHTMRILIAVRGPQIGIFGPDRRITVFDKICRILNGSRSQVGAEHWLCPDGFAELNEFIGPELIRLNGMPGEIAAAWTLLSWT